jgi:hypothetical protein
MPRLNDNQPISLELARAALQEANLLQADIKRFEQAWPTPPATFTPMPFFSWEQLERQVVALATRPDTGETARLALAGWRARARTVPPEMLLKELLVVAWAAMDETFLAIPMREPEQDYGEADMP